jgi:eukaryotic translation initiation factor 2C
MLDELTEMLLERLQVYERKNKVLPDRIFVYRDGVSEVSDPFLVVIVLLTKDDQGQFDIVITEELPQILNAFKKLNTKDRNKAYRPQLSIIICG